jgi:hypothetical protein
MKCLGLYNKPEAEVNMWKMLTGPEQQQQQQQQEEEEDG